MQQQPESVAEWMRYARGDLALAKPSADPEVLLAQLCFHAQQAAEKAIKAVLIHFGVEPPWTHSIAQLIGLLPTEAPKPPPLLAAASLTAYAVTSRYPRRARDVTDDEYRQALCLAQAVVQWAAAIVGQ